MSPDQDQVMDAAQEEWRPVKHYEGMYSVSNLGRVRSEERFVVTKAGWKRPVKGRILQFNKTNRGLLFVTLSWQGQLQSLLVHNLVAEAFLGPKPDGLVVKHGPGGKLDNRAENLSYALPKGGKERMAGVQIRYPRGEQHWLSKLDDKAVRMIRSMPRSRGMVKKAAEAYGVSVVTIYSVLRRKTWAHVT